MYKRILDIDYDALLNYLASLPEVADDQTFFEFDNLQSYLAREVELMMTCDDPDTAADQCLIDIMIEDLEDESVVDYVVTSTPGRVVTFDGHPLMIPLVLIVVQRRTPWQSIPKRET
ncbi:hypothetical protein D3C79_47930 [compost metagenome]